MGVFASSPNLQYAECIKVDESSFNLSNRHSLKSSSMCNEKKRIQECSHAGHAEDSYSDLSQSQSLQSLPSFYEKGQLVSAKWSEDNVYYPAKIKCHKTIDNELFYKVKFYDNVVSLVNHKYVENVIDEELSEAEELFSKSAQTKMTSKKVQGRKRKASTDTNASSEKNKRRKTIDDEKAENKISKISKGKNLKKNDIV